MYRCFKLAFNLFLLFGLFLLTVSLTQADSNHWASHGPVGGTVAALVTLPDNPATAYAGTWGGGIFKTTNGGDSWTDINDGLTNFTVYALAINPVTPTTLYAGTDSRGVFKSVNGGSKWVSANSGLTQFNVHTLAIDPLTPATIYAGSVNGVFQSVNAGGSWQAKGLVNFSIQSLAIDPISSTTLYAGTNNGIFKSADTGATWTAINAGLTDLFIHALVIDPSAPATLYAGTNNGIFKSADAGATWTAINTGLTGPGVYTLALDPSAPATLYAGTNGGSVFKTTDGGQHWTATNLTLNAAVYTLALNSTTLYAGANSNGVLKTADGGQHWSAVNVGLISTVIYNTVFDPTTTTLYAGADGGGMFKSADNGATWTPINTGLTNGWVRALVLDQSITPYTLYAGTKGGVFKSVNDGDTWLPTSLTYTIIALAIDRSASPPTLYAGTWGKGVFKSVNQGNTWTAINTGLPALNIMALAVDNSTTPAIVYAGIEGKGVFKSANQGNTWTAINTGLDCLDIRSLAVDPTTPELVYAGTRYHGIFISADGGAHWAQANNTTLSSRLVYALAADVSTTPATLYVGTDGGLIFKGTDGGHNWTAISDPITNWAVLSLAINPDNSGLYAGSWGGGVFNFKEEFENLPVISIDNIERVEGDSENSLVFTARLSAASQKPVSVEYATQDDTAWGGDDYVTAPPTLLNFPPNTTTQTATITIKGDAWQEENERFWINLSNSINATLGEAQQASVTLINDDDQLPPEIRFSDPTYLVDETAGKATFTITLSIPSDRPVTVNYATTNDTAIAGSDYTPLVGTFTFTPGVTSHALTIPIADDTDDEPDETFALTLSQPRNASLGSPNPAMVIIVDDDLPPTTTLDFTKSALDVDGEPLLVSDTIRYTLRVTNTGSYTAWNVNVTDNLPAGMNLEGLAARPGSVAGAEPIVWNVGHIPPNGGIATLVLTVTLTVETLDQSLVNTAWVEGDNMLAQTVEICPDNLPPGEGGCLTRPSFPPLASPSYQVFLPVIITGQE